MKSILCLVAFLSGSLWACPDYSGTYKNCINHYLKKPHLFEVTITQTNEGGNYHYLWEAVKGRPLSHNAKCVGDKLVTVIPEGIQEISIEDKKLTHKYFPNKDRKNPTVITCDNKI